MLSANYILASLKDVMSAPYGDGPCMHEALFDDEFLKDTGVTTLDFAKALIDEGYHPMTVYFPLVVHGAMLIEPTETESKATLDKFMPRCARSRRGQGHDRERFHGAPMLAPRRRLDETAAARKPVLRWRCKHACASGGIRIVAFVRSQTMTTTASSRRLAGTCQNMNEIRDGVDALDRELVALLVERQRYMEQAAVIKKNRADIRDEARISDVIAKVLGEAKRRGLSKDIAEPVWRTLIERCIAHELKTFDALS